MILPTIAITKLLPLANRPTILAQIDIALKLQHARRTRIARLWIKRHVPHARRAILRIAAARRVDKVLLRRRVRAHQRDEVVRVDGLCGEELEQRVGRVGFGGEQARGPGFGVVFAPDEGADAWAEGTYDGGDVGAELDHVGHGEAVLVVFGVPFFGLLGDL